MTTTIHNAAPFSMEKHSGSIPTCVYIAGSGRNGSTLLGLHLGKHRDIFFAGELTHIWRRSYLNDELCGCGERFSSCEFWRAVTRVAFGKFSGRDARHILRLRDKISSFWRVPLLAAGLYRRSGGAEAEYAAAYKALLAAISTVSGARCLVDSSKYPTDLALLSRTEGIPLRVIHVVRDCNAVVFSWKRKRSRPEIHWRSELMPRYSALTTAVGWRLFNSAIATLSLRLGPPYTLLRYEDLVASFPETLAELFDWLGCPAEPSHMSGRLAHSVSGNPCRFGINNREIKLDDEWRERMSTFDRKLVALVCGGPQRFYGYDENDSAWAEPRVLTRRLSESSALGRDGTLEKLAYESRSKRNEHHDKHGCLANAGTDANDP